MLLLQECLLHLVIGDPRRVHHEKRRFEASKLVRKRPEECHCCQFVLQLSESEIGGVRASKGLQGGVHSSYEGGKRLICLFLGREEVVDNDEASSRVLLLEFRC